MSRAPTKILIEGLDRLGKSTLIKNIRNLYGYYEVIHYEKPQKLTIYEESAADCVDTFSNEMSNPLFLYQEASFKNMFRLIQSSAKIIFDRAHLGEMVYAPLYRKYSGDYVIQMELDEEIHYNSNVRLILLTEDFETSKHFKDDGQSFDPAKREDEQFMFINAFNRSYIADKRIVCVTDADGNFKPEQQILKEAMQ